MGCGCHLDFFFLLPLGKNVWPAGLKKDIVPGTPGGAFGQGLYPVALLQGMQVEESRHKKKVGRVEERFHCAFRRHQRSQGQMSLEKS